MGVVKHERWPVEGVDCLVKRQFRCWRDVTISSSRCEIRKVVDSRGNECTERMTSACRNRSFPLEQLVRECGAIGLCEGPCSGLAQR